MKKEEEKKQTLNSDNSFGVASVVLGIMGIVFSGVYGLVPAVISLVFAKKQEKTSKNSWAKWGKTLSIIGILLSIAVIIFTVWIAKKYNGLA